MGGTSCSILWVLILPRVSSCHCFTGEADLGPKQEHKILSKHIWPFHGLQYLLFKSLLNPHFGMEPGYWLPVVRWKDSQALCKPGSVLSDLTLKEANEARL